jgi:hypothetical protein
VSVCTHENFDAAVGVHRLTHVDGGPVTGYSAEVRIRCTHCGVPFEFLGLQPGIDTQGARVSMDGQELRIAITPPGMKPNPLQRLSANVKSFDS